MWIVVKQSWNSRRLDHEPLNWVMIIQQSLMLVWFWLNAGQDEPAIKLTVYICLDRCLPSSTNILGRGDYCLYDSLCPSCNASLPLGCQQHVIIVWSDIQWGHSGYQQPHQLNFSHHLITDPLSYHDETLLTCWQINWISPISCIHSSFSEMMLSVKRSTYVNHHKGRK